VCVCVCVYARNHEPKINLLSVGEGKEGYKITKEIKLKKKSCERCRQEKKVPLFF
jgi:hypothetical protein